jgi:hypothetical protein
MMIAVAILALVLGGVIGMNEMERRADLLRKEADYHRLKEEGLEAEAANLEAFAEDPWARLTSGARNDAIQRARAYRRAARHHARLRMRYERAAMDPWLTLESDSAAPGR